MADDADQAQRLDERARAGRVAAVRAQVAGGGAEECEECGASIAPLRRRAMPSATRCIGCQARIERRRITR